jgi:hypothetical protein
MYTIDLSIKFRVCVCMLQKYLVLKFFQMILLFLFMVSVLSQNLNFMYLTVTGDRDR